MALIEKETRNFHIEVDDPKELPGGEVEARIRAKPLGEEGSGYDEKIKVKGRSCSEYSNNIQDVYQLENSEQEELKTEIMKLKNDIREKAGQQENLDNNQPRDMEEDFNEILHHIMSAGGTLEVEALQADYEVMAIVDEMDPQSEYVFPVEGRLTITDKGEQKVKEYLGFEAFEGDPEAEAQEQLENNPLRYYLDSFNKIHKGDHLLKIWELISALSATCADRQIHSWAVGPSGKGKSHLKRRLLYYMPKDAYTRKESFSPKALQYKTQNNPSDFMDNQLVYFDEVGENIENAIELIRLLTDQDQDVITHEAVKDQEIIELTMEAGNVTVWFTSVDTIQDEQLKNRFILTNPDASSAQDDTVNEHQQDILNKGGDLDFIPKEAPVIQRMVREIRENTPDYKPIVPFHINWKQNFNRRLYPFFYTLMGMIAKIHYKNRETRDGHIFVTKADFELAKLIWGTLIDTTVAQTDEESIKLLKQLPENRDEAIDRQQLRLQLSGFSTNKVKETCDKLEETEELQLINTDYEEGRYVHWAGADVKKLVDNKPEIEEFNKDTVIDMLNESGVEPDEELLDSIFNTEIMVTDYLIEKAEERKEEIEEQRDDGPDVEITDEEEIVLEQMKEFAWDADLNSLEQMYQDKDIDFVDVATTLEEKEVISIDGDNMPSPKAKLDELKAAGEVML